MSVGIVATPLQVLSGECHKEGSWMAVSRFPDACRALESFPPLRGDRRHLEKIGFSTISCQRRAQHITFKAGVGDGD